MRVFYILTLFGLVLMAFFWLLMTLTAIWYRFFTVAGLCWLFFLTTCLAGKYIKQEHEIRK